MSPTRIKGSETYVKFVLFTYMLMALAGGLAIALGYSGLTTKTASWMYLFILIGGWSPTIVSYYVLKRDGQVSSLREWLRNLFDVKHSLKLYLLLPLFLLLHFGIRGFLSDVDIVMPWYYVILLIPAMVIGGGLEEAGWRYILQPALEKRMSFIPATLVTSVIWAVWHLPLFFIVGTGQYGKSFLVFTFQIIGLSFALACIRKISNSVWLCVLFHSCSNALANVFIVKSSVMAAIITAVVMAVVSISITMFDNNKRSNVQHPTRSL